MCFLSYPECTNKNPHPFPGQSRQVVYVYWCFCSQIKETTSSMCRHRSGDAGCTRTASTAQYRTFPEESMIWGYLGTRNTPRRTNPSHSIEVRAFLGGKFSQLHLDSDAVHDTMCLQPAMGVFAEFLLRIGRKTLQITDWPWFSLTL